LQNHAVFEGSADLNFKTTVMVDSVLLFLGAQEIILIVLALLLLFGGRKIPELMRGMGRGIREFKEGQKESPKEETPKEELEENKR